MLSQVVSNLKMYKHSMIYAFLENGIQVNNDSIMTYPDRLLEIDNRREKTMFAGIDGIPEIFYPIVYYIGKEDSENESDNIMDIANIDFLINGTDNCIVEYEEYYTIYHTDFISFNSDYVNIDETCDIIYSNTIAFPEYRIEVKEEVFMPDYYFDGLDNEDRGFPSEFIMSYTRGYPYLLSETINIGANNVHITEQIYVIYEFPEFEPEQEDE